MEGLLVASGTAANKRPAATAGSVWMDRAHSSQCHGAWLPSRRPREARQKSRLIMTEPSVPRDLTATRRNIASAATPAGAGGAGGSRPRSSKKAPDPPLADEAGFDFPELVLRNPKTILAMYTSSSDTCRRCPIGTSRLEGRRSSAHDYSVGRKGVLVALRQQLFQCDQAGVCHGIGRPRPLGTSETFQT